MTLILPNEHRYRGDSEQTVAERPDLPCTCQARHELESITAIVVAVGNVDYWQGSAWQHIRREPGCRQSGQGRPAGAGRGEAGSELRQNGQAAQAAAYELAECLRPSERGRHPYQLLP